MDSVPVITIDGPSGAGKGTVACLIAANLGYHLLDSGAVYRAAGLHALLTGADLTSEAQVLQCIEAMKATFTPNASGVQVELDGKDITAQLRSERAAAAASKVAIMPLVRASLLDEQRSFRTSPGLVADGRDMGTVVFPDAQLKVFLSASAPVRASRRARQLKEKGLDVNMESLIQEIATRDERDSSREHSPLIPAADAVLIDSSDMPVSAVVQRIMNALHACVGETT